MYKVRIKSADGHDYFLDLQGPVVDIKVEEIEPSKPTFYELRQTGRTSAAAALARDNGAVLVCHDFEAARQISKKHCIQTTSVTGIMLKDTLKAVGRVVVDHAVWELASPDDLARLRAILKDGV